VLTGAVQSTTTVQQSYPQCVVTVYVTGTATKATIYANNNATPTPLSNPFTSSVTGLWQFFAANGVYDVQFSGSNIPAPFTIGAVTLFDQYAANDPFNILGYGAVGDGITDNSGAIQKAFNAAQAAGGTVLIPPGNFKYSTTLIVTGS
jgi:polygalacturonase